MLAVFLATLAFTMFFVLNNSAEPAFGISYPDWLPDDYTVGITLAGYDNKNAVTSKALTGNETTVGVYIFYRVPEDEDAKDVKVRIRTKNGTAVAGADYDAFDSTITLKRSYYSSVKNYYFDYFSIAIKNNAHRFIIDGKRPYFDIELYDVLTEGFTIEEKAKTLRVNLS